MPSHRNQEKVFQGQLARNVCSISATSWSNQVLFRCNNISSNYTNSSKCYSIAQENERQIRVSTLYFIIFIKKEINKCVRINIDVFFYKNHDEELWDMSHNYSRLIFFEGVITGHHFWYGAVLPETYFTFWKFITCLSLLAKQLSQY